MVSPAATDVEGRKGFRIEPYGPEDCRVLRYFNGSVIREAALNDYFTAKEKASRDGSSDFHGVLERGNNDNWHIPASTICMASSIWTQKSKPVEWDEARTFQLNANNVFAKANMLLDCIQSTNKLKMNHTVTQHETNTQLVKYAIHSRNQRLKDCSKKATDLAERISRSLSLQLKFLEMISEIKSQFKVLINARNLVDVSTFDVDYPASFSVFVVFYDVALNSEDSGDTKIWEAWDLHKLSSPTATQKCLISYYEKAESDGLMTCMTFPLAVSHFIQKNYSLSVNGANVPVYNKEEHEPASYRLKKAQMCLIDRLIFTTLCQRSLGYLRSQAPVVLGNATVYVKKITSEELVILYENYKLTVSYGEMERIEQGDVVWRLIVMKLRDIAIQNWKGQVYLHQPKTPDIFTQFIEYTIKLLS